MRKVLIVIIIVIMAVLTVSCDNPSKEAKQVLTPPDVGEQPVVAFGTVKPTTVYEIALDFPAVVKVVHVIEGQRVKQGDILLTLDLAEVNNEINEYKTEALRLEKELQVLKRNYSNEYSRLINNEYPDIKQLQNNIEAASAALLDARKNLSLNEALFRAGSLPRVELDQCRKEIDAGENSIKNLYLQIENLKYHKGRELEKLQQEILRGESKLLQLHLQIGAIQKKLENSFLKNDELICKVDNGLVASINCQNGTYANRAFRFLRIIDLDKIIIEANIDEQFICRVKERAKVFIIPEADREHLYTGKITFISSAAGTINGETTVPVHIAIDKRDQFLVPGFNVEVKIEID